VCVEFEDGTGICGDLVIFARNKFGNTHGLNLGGVVGPDGLDDRGYICVNDHWQTALPHIYAVGNVIAHTGVP
jgi:NAD(P)H-nitrite reductase large subunit